LPERNGNNLAFSLQNIVENPNVGIIASLPNAGETLRINGKAVVLADSDLLQKLGARGKPALVAVRVSIERAYFQCARALLRARLWDPESWTTPRRISFGKIIAESTGNQGYLEQRIDAMVERGYESL
jgi:predicted pyridoxine 5'-phosphate oxidase superfamily flavin-nucleotide-binding protein